ncbi:MAG: hypothetical protein A3H97_09145 [Acidobacteria bacterium RIFCSPLOWO2_02_FULL_65_29]|nr:MAG: hypothetical protein A3H97_09145 [Acidobacteria bacterium RIFCSPLOWO2_02_FULL_65_29]
MRFIAAALASLLLVFGLSPVQGQTPAPTQPPAPAPQEPAPAAPARGRGALPPGAAAGLLGRRGSPPQPQQRQGIEYFVGSWRLEYIGRESPVGAGPRTGTATFTRKGATNVLEMRTDGQTDAGVAFKESGTAEWNDEQKTMTFRERVAGGLEIVSPGSWSSPLAIRSETQPITVGKETVRVRRVYSIISAVAFTIAEEISINGGPYQRLGHAEYSKVP